MTLSDWQRDMLGYHWQGTVTDDVSGESAAYSWTCDRVTQDVDGRVRFVLGWRERGAYREVVHSQEALDAMTPADLIAEVTALLTETVRQELEARRFDSFVGEEF